MNLFNYSLQLNNIFVIKTMMICEVNSINSFMNGLNLQTDWEIIKSTSLQSPIELSNQYLSYTTKELVLVHC